MLVCIVELYCLLLIVFLLNQLFSFLNSHVFLILFSFVISTDFIPIRLLFLLDDLSVSPYLMHPFLYFLLAFKELIPYFLIFPSTNQFWICQPFSFSTNIIFHHFFFHLLFHSEQQVLLHALCPLAFIVKVLLLMYILFLILPFLFLIPNFYFFLSLKL